MKTLKLFFFLLWSNIKIAGQWLTLDDLYAHWQNEVNGKWLSLHRK